MTVKAMVVSVDKATAVRCTTRCKKHWNMQLAYLQAEPLCKTCDREHDAGQKLKTSVAYMQETDMAVVVSQSQNEIEDIAEEGRGHRAAPQADA